jgi:hypothetical protein
MFIGSRRGSWRVWLVIGLGLCLYGYYELNRLPMPSEAALAQAVETQYRLEVARLQEVAWQHGQPAEAPVSLSPEWETKFRSAIRSEQLAPVEKSRKRAHSLLGAGLILTVLAAGMYVSARQSEKLTAGK